MNQKLDYLCAFEENSHSDLQECISDLFPDASNAERESMYVQIFRMGIKSRNQLESLEEEDIRSAPLSVGDWKALAQALNMTRVSEL